MSQLIVPGGRPVPKKEEPKGPMVVSWAEIVTISDTGRVAVTHYDSDFTSIHCQRKSSPEDVLGACAYIEHQGPHALDSIFDLTEVEGVFKTAFLIACLPNGHVIVMDDLFQPLVTTYGASNSQVFMAASILKVKVSATMIAEMTAPVAGEVASKSIVATLEQISANSQAAAIASQAHRA